MKSRILFCIALAAACICGFVGRGSAYENSADNVYGIDADLFDMYVSANKHYSSPKALAIGDSMLLLARQRGDATAQCLALEIPIDFYNSQQYIDMARLRLAIDSLRLFAFSSASTREFGYKAWRKLVMRLINRHDNIAALAETGQMLDEARRHADSFGMFWAYMLYGRIYDSMGDRKAAMASAQQAIAHIGQSPTESFALEIFSDMASYQIKLSRFDSAMHYIKKIEDAPHANNSSVLRALLQKAQLMDSIGHYAEMGQIADTFRARAMRQTYSHAYYMSQLHQIEALFYMGTGRYEEALQECDSIGNNMNRYAMAYRIHESMGDWDGALNAANALDSTYIAESHLQLTQYLARQDSALKTSLVETARQQALAENANRREMQLAMRREMSETELQRIATEQQLLLTKAHADSLSLDNAAKARAEAEAKFERTRAEQKASEASLRRRDMAHERNTAAAMIGILLVAALMLAAWYYLRNNKAYMLSLRHKKEHTERLARQKNDTIHTIRHEIRTPLNAITGFAYLLDLPYDANAPDDEREQYIGYIRDNTLTLTQVIESVVTLSRLDSGETEARREPVFLAETAAEAVTAATPKPHDGVEIVNAISDPQLEISADHEMLAHILSELLGNACKYTTAGEIRLGCDMLPEKMVLTCTDSGPGIPAAKAEQAFARFEKLGSVVQGVGLGLSICRAMAAKMGGEISIDTAYTSGCRAVLCLPRQPRRA